MKEGLDFVPLSKLGKIGLNAVAGLVGLRENGYIPGNLWFSYDRVLRVGPLGPALFYYLNRPDAENAAPGSGNTAGPARGRPQPNASQTAQVEQL